MKRRRFVRQSAVALPVLYGLDHLWSCKGKDDDPEARINPFDVLPQKAYNGKIGILGAGAAGLYSAKLLAEAGYTVKVLEATNRVGGRVLSNTAFADFPVEMGAEEIHGSKSNWYGQLKTLNPNFRATHTKNYLFLDGELKEAAGLGSDPDFTKAKNLADQAGSYSGIDETVGKYATGQAIASRFLPYLNAILGNRYGTDNTRLSIKGLAEEMSLATSGTDRLNLANLSLQSAMETLWAKGKEKVVLNWVAKTVEYDETGMVKVTSKTGQVEEFDKLIITMSLNVLRGETFTILPGLPAEKITALDKLGMGGGLKICLRFSERFWGGDTGRIFGAGLVPEYWDSSLGRSTQPALTALVMGAGYETLSALPDPVEGVKTDLRAVFGAVVDASFQDAILKDWGKDPYFVGAFSYPKVGAGVDFRRSLAKPVLNKLFFAGEATHYKGHSGTVHGAMETGYRAALELVNGLI